MALVLLPFFLFHEFFDQWSTALLTRASGQTLFLAAVIIGLLAGDVLLPVPSTILSTGAGYLFGFAGGTLVSFIGMGLGAGLGYWLGARSRRSVSWLDVATTRRLATFFDRHGSWAIAMARPIPVLAETSVLFAGLSGLSFRRFFTVAALSNLGISLVYAWIGTRAVSTGGFLLAFAGSMAIPLLWFAARLLGRWKGKPR